MDLRPRIYVYDLPPQFNVRLLQYRGGKRVCTHRQAFPEMFVDSDYGAETALHEALLGSPYRTHDPETADFFFVPVYLACYLHPVWRYSSYPDYAPGCHSRTVSGMRLLRAASAFVAQAQLEKKGPGHYWMRRRGTDHVWHMPHDEGACWAPREIRQGVMVTPYGYHAGAGSPGLGLGLGLG